MLPSVVRVRCLAAGGAEQFGTGFVIDSRGVVVVRHVKDVEPDRADADHDAACATCEARRAERHPPVVARRLAE